MHTVQEVKSAVSQLPKGDLARFREWFEEFDAELWDEQFEADVASGKFDEFAHQAISDFKAGKCKAL